MYSRLVHRLLALLRSRRTCLRTIVALLSLAFVLGSVGCLTHRIGGAFRHQPAELEAGLSPAAKELVRRAFAGLDAAQLLDHHTHVVGTGFGETGCFVHPHMQSPLHPIARLKFSIYASAAGVTDQKRADALYVARLVDLVRHIPGHGSYLLLAFDKHYRADGSVNLAKTEFYTPNDYVLGLAEKYPDLFEAAASVHPYRADALAELRRVASRGARLIKWLPNAMGIDPADARCQPFYQQMRELGMVLLTHAGEEKAVEADEDQQLGNPLRLRAALDAGVQVVVAHAASLGRNQDLDSPKRELRDNFDLFLRLMDEPRYRGLLYGEISAMTQFNRLPRPLITLLQRTDLHDRLVNGSDYPLPAINIIIRTKDLVKAGLITKSERALLNEIYHYNPLLFDFVVKRTLRAPGTDIGFPAQVFLRHPALRARPPAPKN